ncbi:MAG: 2-oxoacid:acceptor oxidoreductase subunit alpha [Planctomycetes bacterium]|nr:2-oxoacid:acceptor oxidoreductase subunit alpha [Planctomycetota bacterium]
MVSDLIFGMAGSGGDGVVSAGESLLAAVSSHGYLGMMTKSFGPQIRGGESSARVRVATKPVHNPGGVLDVAVALNWEDFQKFGTELPLARKTVLIHEAKCGPPPPELVDPADSVHAPAEIVPKEIVAVPIAELTKASAGTEKAKTSVVLGLLCGWFGVPEAGVKRGLAKKFGKKGEGLLESNERALAAGIEFARTHPLESPRRLDEPPQRSPKLLCDGNDLCASAALFAGCEFFGGYPITPSTEVMQTLSREIWKYGGAVLQAEDEIAGIGAALGASFAGKKSMTATSGPGMALKTEILGLATIAELPLVILDVQRGGPATGIPTKSEQADLFQAVFSAHGDVLRPVLAPVSVADTFAVTVEAFNLAERYQTPVIVLSDQELAQRKEIVEPIELSRFTLETRVRPNAQELVNYQRFRLTENGVSPISHPGQPGGSYLGAGIEHNQKGDPTASGEVHAQMTKKRFAKFAPLEARRDLFEVFGPSDAPFALISWGSSAGVAREACELANAKGLRTKLLVPRLLWPIAAPIYREFLASVEAGLVVELSYQGQLLKLLRMELDLPKGLVSFSRSGANPFRPDQVLAALEARATAGVR